MNQEQIEQLVDLAWESRLSWNAENIGANMREAIMAVVAGLNDGSLRVAEKIDGAWVTHQWIKKAVLMCFRLLDNEVMRSGPMTWYDKLSLKFSGVDGSAIAS